MIDERTGFYQPVLFLFDDFSFLACDPLCFYADFSILACDFLCFYAIFHF